MHSSHVASSDFRQVIQSLVGLPDHQQIATLKAEFFRAQERANLFRAQYLKLQQSVADLQWERAERGQEHSAFAARLNAELVKLTSELSSVRAEHEKRLRVAHLERAALELRCEALDEICRALLLTIEQAATAAAEGDPQAPGASDRSA
ncbi:MAG: hypothetical protein ABSC94_33250 [Polyangiaceae bacterium]